MHQFRPAFILTVWPLWALGIARGLNHAFGFVGFWYAGRVMKKLSAYTSLVTGSISARVIGMVAVGFPTIFSPLLLSIDSLIYCFSSVAKDTLLQKEFTQKQRATMDSLNSFAGNIVFAVFAYCFGLFADAIGPAKALFIGELLLLGVVWFYLNVHRFHVHQKSVVQG